MMMDKGTSRRIVSSRPGQGTGETIYTDDQGQSYREVSAAEAQLIESGTAGRTYKIYPNGTVK